MMDPQSASRWRCMNSFAYKRDVDIQRQIPYFLSGKQTADERAENKRKKSETFQQTTYFSALLILRVYFLELTYQDMNWYLSLQLAIQSPNTTLLMLALTLKHEWALNIRFAKTYSFLVSIQPTRSGKMLSANEHWWKPSIAIFSAAHAGRHTIGWYAHTRRAISTREFAHYEDSWHHGNGIGNTETKQ